MADWGLIAAVTTWVLVGGDAPTRPFALLLLILTAGAAAGSAIYADGVEPFRRLPVAAWLFAVLVVLVPAVQIVPLPADLWTALPGRSEAVASLDLVGAAGEWRPLSLSVNDTVSSAAVVWATVCLSAATLRLRGEQVGAVLRVLFLLGLVHIALGMLQILSRGSFYPYSSSRGMYLVGFFANKNHSGLFIAITVLTGFAGYRRYLRDSPSALYIAAAAVLVIIAALFATNSRAGLFFGAMAIAFAALLYWGQRVGRRGRTLAIVGLALVAVAAVLGSTDIATSSLRRFDTTNSDLRWLFWQWSAPLARGFWPVGSGLGSFPTVFAAAEQLAWVKPTYVNHAHNDYLEQVMEIGAAAPLLWVLALATVLPPMVRTWRKRESTEGIQALAAGAIVLLILLHSGFDYPLRRPALAMVFAVAIAIQLRGVQSRTLARTEGMCEGAAARLARKSGSGEPARRRST